MDVLLLEPYYGGSHRAWADGYVAHSQHRVTLLSLPARFWKWRMQGAAVTLATAARELAFRPDVILASDMTNLPAFLGLTRDVLSDVPVALYLHENQLTYPLPPGETRDLTYGMVNWLSMLAADRVFFNSAYHLADWFEELPRLLKHFPDLTHTHRIDEVRARAEVLPVGCDLRRFDGLPDTRTPASEAPLILWNGRWEYDKNPQTFLRALEVLVERGIPFRVALAGKNTRQAAPEFEAARQQLGERVIHFGYAAADRYGPLLRQADLVVSTAIHEFFGVGIVEAIYCGCFPVLPHRLVYPQLIPAPFHGACLFRGFDTLVDRLCWGLTHRERARTLARELKPAVAGFDWGRMAPRYDEALSALLAAD